MESVSAILEFSSKASVLPNALMALLKSATSAADVMHHVLLALIPSPNAPVARLGSNLIKSGSSAN